MGQRYSLMEDSSFIGGARNKAGMPETGGLERQRIDDLIKEFSKGSKFSEHQHKREQRVMEKIEKLKQKKAQYEKMFARDMGLWDRHVKELDRYTQDLENERDLSRTIVCVDMDAFYAAVETLERPDFAKLPIAVGGKSMLCTANYEARKYGVVSGMPGYIAMKLCPQLHIIEPNFEKYKRAADIFHQVFRRFDENFSYFSLDEATLDITQKIAQLDLEAEQVVSQMRQEVFEASGLTCSAGIAPNKMLAKIASNIKKPNGQYYLEGAHQKVIDFIHGTRLAKVNGIGKVTAKVLEGVLGASTVGQLWEQRVWAKLLFSEIQSDFLIRCCLGVGSINNSDHESERQSLSTERTFPTVSDPEKMVQVLSDLCLDLSKQLEMEGLAGKNIGIKMKSSDFSTTTRAITLKRFIWSEADLFNQAKNLLLKFHPPDLRLLGVRMASLDQIENVTPEESIETFLSKNENAERLAKCPVCLQAISGAPEMEESEAVQKTINDHVDLCLAKGFEGATSQPTPEIKQQVYPQKRRAAPNNLDIFFKKAK